MKKVINKRNPYLRPGKGSMRKYLTKRKKEYQTKLRKYILHTVDPKIVHAKENIYVFQPLIASSVVTGVLQNDI